MTDKFDHNEMTVERMLGQRIHAFSNMITGHFYRRTEQPLGVSLPEWRVLRSVLLHPGTSQGEVAGLEGLNVMNVSRAVAGLRRKGLVDVQPDPEDRRRTMLSATEVGEGIGADIATREGMVYEHVFSVLSRDEVEHLDEVLDRVNEALREVALPDPPPASRDWAAVIEENAEQS
ncbi:MAG: winged helix-turn-helix transcriptional regulator [Acidimicrobiales bacterium]|nr:winged helix-turn-helix transcriptional regulator [Acidimicrobiales bacterium]RZV47008.1 MAG: MarR family transcriptional regulator [Acidimicrobiales bacterium]